MIKLYGVTADNGRRQFCGATPLEAATKAAESGILGAYEEQVIGPSGNRGTVIEVIDAAAAAKAAK